MNKKKKNYSISEAADYLIEQLLDMGFTIQRYDAYSTNSIYLKLDYGLCNSIRISDHNGKKHLHYMFNVLTSHKGNLRRRIDEFTRYYYKSNKHQMNMLLEKIRSHRKKKMAYYGGPIKYRRAMKEQLEMNKHNKGFWSMAKVVNN